MKIMAVFAPSSVALRVLWWSDRIQSDRGPSFIRYIRVDEFKDSQEAIDREEEDEK